MSILHRTMDNIITLGQKNVGRKIGYQSTPITELAMALLRRKGKIKTQINQRNHSFWLI